MGWSLLTYLHRFKGITLGSTLLATGTTPPVVTVVSQPTRAVALYVQCDTAGVAGGGATYKWSIDGGATFQATLQPLSVGTVTLGFGIQVSFAAGIYATDNVYKGTASNWVNQALSGYDFKQATAAMQPLIEHNGMYGNGSLLTDGTNDYLFNGGDGSDIAGLLGGTDTPLTVFCVVQPIATGTRRWFAMGHSSGANTRQDFANATTLATVRKTDDTNTTATTSTSPTLTVARHCIAYIHTGTALQYFVDTVSVVSAASDVGNMTMDRAALMATILAGTFTAQGSTRISEYLIFRLALPQEQVRRIQVRQGSLYGVNI